MTQAIDLEAAKQEFEEKGFVILRNVLTDAEVERLARPIRASFTRGDYDTVHKGPAYPAPGIHSMGPRVLEDNPDIAEVSFAHPKIMDAIETLFGEPATLAQYWSIMRPPGAGLGDEPYLKGSGAHYDYKPWRCVGSYVKWLFAIIPFVDYTETVGPLTIAPGSHRKTTILPSNGRVHPVDAAQVQAPEDIELVDPSLKRGDVVLMNGFSWHEPLPNYGNSDRCGLYMKFHAKSSPPACGPTIYPSSVHEVLPDDAKHLVPYHRNDGKYAAVRTKPVDCIEEARLLIEDSEEKVLVLGSDADDWRLPSFAAAEDETAGILDTCNVMGSVTAQARDRLGLQLPWLSWLADIARDAAEDDPDAKAGEERGDWRCRVYGHRLADAAPSIDGGGHRWMSADELADAKGADRLEDGEAVLHWLHMWQHEQDEDGNPVTRSFGVPTTDVDYFTYNHNRAGVADGPTRVGEFEESGRPVPAGA